jgi:hypothetical protein
MMSMLPGCESTAPKATREPAPAAPRLREADRTQLCLRPVDLESLLTPL